MIQMLKKIYKRIFPKTEFDPDRNTYLHRYAVSTRSVLEGDNILRSRVRFVNSSLGRGSYISEDTQLRQVEIGRYSCIGPNVKNGFWLHPSRDFVSVHPAFYSLEGQAGFKFTDSQKFKEMKYADKRNKWINTIGSDVWIGAHVLIMPGVSIADGAIVATGSVVTKDVAPYSVVGGVPAKVIRFRFDSEDVAFLLRTKWWLWEKERLAEAADHFTDVDSLKGYLR